MHFSRKIIFFVGVMCLINLAIIIPVYADVTTVTYVTQWGSSPTSPGFFKSPYGIAEDESGNVYIADTDNNRIQKFTSDGAFILQWGSSGSGNGQFNGPEGIAIDHDGNVYITDWGNNRIQKFTSAGSYLTQWGSTGTGNGQFQNPWGIAVDTSGNVYVFDNQINRIQKFSSAGTYLTQWGSTGTGNGQFNNPRGIAIDSSSNVYVSDSQNNRIQKFSSTGTYLAQWGSQGYGDGQFSYPEGITADNNGNIYVADWGFHRIQKFASDGTFLTKWGAYGNGNGQFVSPRDVVADSSGNVYVADTDNNRIQKFTSTGVFVRKWGDTTAAGRFTNPSGVVADRSGNVLVVDTSNYRIQKFTSDGTYITLWGSYGTGNGQFHYPRRAAVDSVGNVYVVDWWGTNPIQKLSSTGTFVTKWGSTGTGNGQFGNLNGIQGIAIDSKDNVYVTDFDNNRVQKFSSSGTYLTQWGSKGSGNGQFDGPWGIAVDGSDNVYVADNSNNRVQKFTSEGTYSSQWGTYGTGNGQLWGPKGIAIDSSGNVFIADSGNNRIQMFGSSGTYLTQWGSSGSGDGQFLVIQDISSDKLGNIYVADSSNSRIQKFSINAVTPTITGIIPSSALNSGTVSITNLSGSGFASGATVYLIKNGESSIPATNIAVVSPNKITCTFDLTGAAPGLWEVDVQNPGSLTAGSSIFTVNFASAAPVASFTATQTSGTLGVSFTDTSTNSPTSWAWDFQNDGTIDSTLQNPTFTYSDAGTYTVKLTVTNARGSGTSVTRNFSVAAIQVPVVLIHGVAEGSDTWDDLISELDKEGIPYYNFVYGQNDKSQFFAVACGDPRDYASDLSVKIIELKNGNEPLQNFNNSKGYSGKFDIVCHSMGALVSRYYMEKLNGRDNVRQWIGIAPANHGAAFADVNTALTYFTRGEAGIQLKTTSPTVTSLSSDVSSDSIKYHAIVGSNYVAQSPGFGESIVSELDVMLCGFGQTKAKDITNNQYYCTFLGDGVVAAEQSILTGSSTDYIEGSPHSALPHNPTVLSLVIRYLKNPDSAALYNLQSSSSQGTSDTSGDSGTSTAPSTAQNAPSSTTSVNVGGNSAVSQVSLTGTGVKDAIVTAFLEQSLPESTPSLNTPVYEYIAITPTRVTTVSSAEITFTVTQSWLDEHHVTLGTVFDPCPVVLERLHDGQWTSLPTQYSGNVYGTPTFTAQSPGFSTFAITINPNITATTTAMQKGGNLTQVTLSTPTKSIREVTQIQTRLSETNVSALPEVTKTETVVNPIFLLGIGCVGFIGLIGGGLLIHRWWIRRQNPTLFKEYK